MCIHNRSLSTRSFSVVSWFLFLSCGTHIQSITNSAELISSVVLKSFLCPKYYCPNSDPHHFLTNHFKSLLSGLLSTFLPLLDLSSKQTPGLYIQIQPISLLNTLSGATLGQSQNSLAYNPLRPSRTISWSPCMTRTKPICFSSKLVPNLG